MRLTTFSDYCLRVLVYVAQQPDRLVTIAELAEFYQISANHLTKVVHFLGQRGTLETVRGKKGGVRLGKPPAEIELGPLIRAAEAGSRLLECFDKVTNACRMTPMCKVRGVLVRAQNAFFATLDGYTLDQVLPDANITDCPSRTDN